MYKTFNELQLPIPKVPRPVHITDPRFTNIQPTEPRTWAIMLQHMDALMDFYNSTKGNANENEYCIICEDDILLKKNIKWQLPYITAQFFLFELDVLLLSYLLPFTIENTETPNYPRLQWHQMHEYPDDVWGSQMYIISKKHAKYLLDTYTIEWAQTHPDEPYSPDWIITKKGKRALIYPPLAIENGMTPTTHEGQRNFHKRCFDVHYKEGDFI